MKNCIRCGLEKKLSEFYAHKQMADGHLNKCIDCVKKYEKDRRKTDGGSIRAYDRQRGQDPKRKAANRAGYRKRISTAAGRRKEWDRSKSYRETRQLQRAANILVGNAVARGKLIPLPCARCGNEKAEAHHEDYTKPMEVVWLCKPCHGRRHREINEERRKK